MRASPAIARVAPKPPSTAGVLLGLLDQLLDRGVEDRHGPEADHPALESDESALAFLQQWSSYGFRSIALFIMVGTLLTIVIQSSSATMVITLTLVFQGWIGLEIAAAMVSSLNTGGLL